MTAAKGRSVDEPKALTAENAAEAMTYPDIFAIAEAARRASGTDSRPCVQDRERPRNVAVREVPVLADIIGEDMPEGSQLEALVASIRDLLEVPVDGFDVVGMTATRGVASPRTAPPSAAPHRWVSKGAPGRRWGRQQCERGDHDPGSEAGCHGGHTADGAQN